MNKSILITCQILLALSFHALFASEQEVSYSYKPLPQAKDTTRGPQLTLSQNGKSDYIIVLPAKPVVSQQTAAKELQTHLKKVTDVELPIVSETVLKAKESNYQGRPQIVIGPSERTKMLLPEVDHAKLGNDTILVKAVGRDLILSGQLPRGPLYATYTFLEEIIGVRWWSATESFIPKRPTLTINPPNMTYTPPFFCREAMYHGPMHSSAHAARLKLNGGINGTSDEYGGHYRWAGFVHTFYLFLPPEKYFKDHPEWYSQNTNGERFHKLGQLCLTNNEMRTEFVKKVLERLRNHPDAKLVSISQNDCHGNCQCKKCKVVEEREGSPSGLMLQFVNHVAEAIEKEFPDVTVTMLAYQYTRKPPKFARPRKNVAIRLCSLECCFLHPLATDESNKEFCEDIQGWKKIAPQLFVWDYVANFHNFLLPHPNLGVLAPNIRFFRDNNVVSLFEQGDGYCRSGDFVRLRAWLIGHLLWNPDLDEKSLIREFVEGYYGPAAPHILAYLKVINEAGRNADVHFGWFHQTTSDWLLLEQLNEATRFMNEAQSAVVGKAPFDERVRRARLPLDHVWVTRFNDPEYLAAKAEGKKQEGPENKTVAIQAFLEKIKHFDVRMCKEARSIEPYLKTIRLEAQRKPSPVPIQCKTVATRDWIDVQDDHFLKAEEGKWTFVEKDPRSSDGLVVRMPSTHHEWALNWSVPLEWTEKTPFQCYAVVRADVKSKTKGTDKVAIQIGIYDREKRCGVYKKDVKCNELADGEYHAIDLGTQNITSKMYFWFAPPQTTGGVVPAVENVYVDRIFLVRKKLSKEN